MNTSKLLSIISSTVGNGDRGSRAADPAHGLDFSQLLGERRSQVSAGSAVTPRPARTEARRDSTANAPSRTDGPARNDNRRDTAAAPAGGATPSAPASNNQTAPETGNCPGTPVASGGNHAGAQPSPDSKASSSADAAPGNAGQETGTGAAADAQLAQDAAEAGLVAVVATGLAAQAGPAGAAAAETVTPGQAVQAGATPGTIGATAATPAGVAVLATLDADDVQAPLAPLAGKDQRLPAGRQAQALQTVPAAATPVATNLAQAISNLEAVVAAPAAATATATATADAPAPAGQPAAGLPLPVVTDMAGSAAARSLQDFTAMVAAARATSGTVLAPSALASQPALPAMPFSMAGLMPAAGLLPGQASPGAAPLAGGIAAPLGSPQWPTELGRQFISITQAGNGLGQVAELRLDPPDLGPLRITINLNDNVAHAVFSSPHALVRQTVENALPQLQQMLEQAGISLGQANVNDQQSGQASQQQAGPGLQARANGTGPMGEGMSDAEAARQNRPADPSALVDTFA